MNEYKTILKSFDSNTLEIVLNALKRLISNIGVILGFISRVGGRVQKQQFNIMYIIGQKRLLKMNGEGLIKLKG